MKEFLIDNKYNNKKIINILTNMFPNMNINTINKALRKKDILVNGSRINSNITISSGDIIKVFISDDLLYGYKTLDLKIVYEDNNILVIDKPTNLEVVGDNSLTNYLQKNIDIDIKPCHRLDRNTTGLVLFAKNDEVLKILLDKFKNKEIEKKYMAKVYGIPKKEKDTLDAYLFKDRKNSIVYISNVFKKGYKRILTSYSIIETNKNNNTSILDISLHTGKTHQIRAHLAHIGLPIIGDGKYGINEINKKFKKKTQLLCSYYLKFNFSNNTQTLDYLNGKEFEIYCNFDI